MKQIIFNNFLCADCKVDTQLIGEYYMLKNEVWKMIVKKNEKCMLCIGCVEERLAKKFGKPSMLTFSAFLHCPLNCQPLIYRSHRLVQRMTLITQ